MNTYTINRKKNHYSILSLGLIFIVFIYFSFIFSLYIAVFTLLFLCIQVIYNFYNDYNAKIIIEEDQLQYIRKNLLYILKYKDISEIKIINNRIRIFDILQFKDIQGNKYGVDYNFINYKDAWMDILMKVKKYNENINNIDDLIKKAQN